uniref:Uncharacterized protein n=1 Tax=Arundo donax TaxID=35708 RepID=A0A0A9FVD7_ARUDO
MLAACSNTVSMLTPPFRCFPFLGPTMLAAQLIEHEDHRRAAHVPELAASFLSSSPSTHSMWSKIARPPGWIGTDAKRVERIDQAALIVLPNQSWYLAGNVEVQATFHDLHGDGVLGFWYGGLRGEGHLEQGPFDGADGVGADDDGACAIAEYPVAEDVVEAALLGAVEGDERELTARHEDARAAVVLGELLGDLERPPAAGAAVEADDGPVDGGAEAEQRREAAVGARGAEAGVGAEDEVGDVGGRAAPLGDGLGRRQLRDGGGGEFHAGVVGVQRAVGEVRVRGEEVLTEVRVPLLDARFLAFE